MLCSPRGSQQARIQNELGSRRIRRLIQSQAIVGTEGEDNIVSRVYSCVVTVKTERYLFFISMFMFCLKTFWGSHGRLIPLSRGINSFSNVHKRYK